MIPVELLPVDACPSCDPGVPDPSLPAGDPEPVDGGIAYPYQCDVCHIGWTTVFDEFGWPLDRLTAPVVPAAA